MKNQLKDCLANNTVTGTRVTDGSATPRGAFRLKGKNLKVVGDDEAVTERLSTPRRDKFRFVQAGWVDLPKKLEQGCSRT